jgi:uncharacterized tellurite resistance protein B-like protein
MMFTEEEKRAISVVILKLIGADRKIHPMEMSARYRVCSEYDIALTSAATKTMKYEQAKALVTAMTSEQKAAIKRMLQDIAASDGIVDEAEAQMMDLG